MSLPSAQTEPASPGAPPAPAAPAIAPRRVLGAADAQIVAWAFVALVNALVIVRTVSLPRVLATRVVHHLYDAGHALALGLISAAVIDVWRRIRPRPAPSGAPFRTRLRRGPALDFAALAALAIALGFPVLGDDLANFAARVAGARGGSSALLLVFTTAGVALGVPLAALLGWLLDRAWTRGIGLVVCVGVTWLNHAILHNDYPGAHLYLAWAGAACGGAALAGLELPWREATTERARRVRARSAWALRFALAIVAAFTVVVWPGSIVMIELYKTSGAVLAPFRGRVQSESGGWDTAQIPTESKEWFKSRADLPDIPPSGPAPADRIVILLFIDSMRYDVLGAPQNAARLPVIGEIRRKSVDFGRARSPGSQTVYTFSAVFSGKYFSQMYWTDKRPDGLWPHEDESVRFPELLAKAGIPTVTFASTRWLINEFGAVRGFTEETVVDPTARVLHEPFGTELAVMSIDRLKKHKGGPLFLFLHFMDPHFPYDRGGRAGTPFERYLDEIVTVDTEIGRLMEAVKTLGMADRTTWIITADHGEAFGEHHTTQHSVSLYEELIRVPLLIHAPGVQPRQVDTPVSLMDLGPTILDWMGVATPPSFMGQSLAPFLRGQTPKLTRPILAEGRLKQVLVYPDNTKVIRDQRRGTLEIYNLDKDRGELRNLHGELADRGAGRAALLKTFFNVHALRRRGYSAPYRP